MDQPPHGDDADQAGQGDHGRQRTRPAGSAASRWPTADSTREERHRLLLEHAGIGIGYYDLNGTTVMYNRRAAELMGGVPADFAGRSAVDVLGEEWGTRVLERIRAAVAATAPLEFEDQVDLPTGRRWLLSTYVAIPGSGDEPAGVQVVSQEITDRKHAEQEILAARANLEALVENTDSAIWSVDPELRLVLGNSVFHDLVRLGFGLEVTPGDPVLAADLPAELRRQWTGWYRRALEGESFRVESTVRRSARARIMEYFFRPIRAADGAVTGVTASARDLTARRLAEAAAAAAEDRFRKTLENAELVAVALDREGCLTFVNDFTLQLTGWRREQVLGRDWFSLFLPASHAAKQRRVFDRTIGTGDFPVHHDNPIVTLTGEERLIRWSNTVIHDLDGGIREVVSLGEDVTERERAREVLVAAQQVGSMGSWVWNPIDETLSWSQQLYRIWGVAEDFELTFDAIEGLIHPVDRAGNRDFVSGLLAGTGPTSEEFRIVRPDGTTRVLWQSVEVVRDGAGRALRAVGIMQDITDRKRAEAALRASEQRYRDLFTSMVEGFALHEILCDPEGVPTDYRFLDANPAFFRLTGLPREILGRTVREVLPETEDYWIETYGRVALSGEPIEFEHFSSALDSHFEVRAFSPRRGQFATVFLDVSERRRSELERARLLAEIRGLAARLAASEDAERQHLAHELHDRVGQSLTALGINLSTLRNLLAADRRGELGPRLDDAEQLLRTTAGDVRDVMAELHPPMLDDYGLLSALRWFGGQLGQRSGLAVTVAGEEPEPRLGAETEMALFRIVQEALTNVVKHARARSVAIEVTQDEAGVTLRVTDDGAGFETAALRTDAAGARRWGLAIMRERAAGVGAACGIASRPGHGTTVTLAVPGRHR